MGRGCSLSYGKIVLVSETEDMTSMVATLSKILREHGYPEAIDKRVSQDEQKKAKEAFEEALEKTKRERDWASGGEVQDKGREQQP